MRHMTNDDIEVIILGIFTVYPNDEEVRKARRQSISWFVPHMPWADNNNLYIGGDPDVHRKVMGDL